MKKMVNKKEYRKAKREAELKKCKEWSERYFGKYENGRWEILPF